MPGVPATPCKKGYKKLKTRLHEEAGGGERRGRGEFTQGTLSRACRSDYFAGRPIVPAILSAPVAHIHVRVYDCGC